MKTPNLYFGALALSCVIALVIGTAGAAAVSGTDGSCSGTTNAHGGPVKMLDRLEEQGYDISAILAAVESGDNATARILMQQFMEAHKDELPQPGAGRNQTLSRGAAAHS